MSAKKITSIHHRHTLFSELTKYEDEGMWFRIEDISGVTRTGRPALKRALAPYIENVMAQLFNSTVRCNQSFVAWERKFLTFEFFIRSSRYALELKYRYITFCVEDGIRYGSKDYIKQIRSQCSASDDEIRRLVTKVNTPLSSPLSVPYTISQLSGKERQTLIYNLYDCYKLQGEAFKTTELARRYNINIHIVSKYGSEYIKELACRLIEEEVTCDLAYFEWNKIISTFRHSLQNSVRAKELSERKVILAIEHLIRNKREVTLTDISSLINLDHRVVKKTLNEWEKHSNLRLVKRDAWKTIPQDELIAILDSRLGVIPLTFLDSPAAGKSMTEKQIRMIYSLRQPGLRNMAFFIMATCYSNRANDITFFYYMSRFLHSLGLEDIYDLDWDTFLKAYHDGDVIKEDNTGQRARFIQTYFRLLLKQGDYFSRLNQEQEMIFSSFALPRLSDDLFWKRSTLHRDVTQKQKDKKKAKTAVLHQKFYFLRDFVERRKLQINLLHKEVNKAIQLFDFTDKKSPMMFEYTDSIAIENRMDQTFTHRFKVWDASLLRLAHEPVAAAKTYYYRDTDPAHVIHDNSTRFITYEGSRNSSNDAVDGLWFIELLSLSALSGSPSAEITRKYGVSRFSFQGPVTTPYGYMTSQWLYLLNKDLGLIFIPVKTLMIDALLAHSAVQIMTKTGARAHEFLQIRLVTDYLYRMKLADNKECIVFNAIPKGRLKEEPFYIDNKCMESLYEWWRYQKEENQSFDIIDAAMSLGKKLMPANYLWQNDGRHFTQKHINGALSVMLHGLYLKTDTGQPVKVTSHLLRHGFATEMRTLNTPLDVLALLMKQKDINVTEYYAKHTPAQLVELQQQIFTQRHDFSRLHIRSKEDVANQLADATGKVGALIPVTGGCCTIANACPAKFACIGCAGNAPDPARRGDVLTYRDAWMKMAELASQQNLPAEERKAREIIGGCDDMLEEMDLIEQVDAIRIDQHLSS